MKKNLFKALLLGVVTVLLLLASWVTLPSDGNGSLFSWQRLLMAFVIVAAASLLTSWLQDQKDDS